MPNKENKDKIDYSKFFEGADKKEKIPEKGKKFSFVAFKDFWEEADEKTRIELIVLLVVIVSIIAVLIFYFLKPEPKGLELPPILPLPVEEEIFEP